MNLTDNIIELNRDMEPFVIQASATRPPPFKAKFGDPYAVLQFLHFSDIHNVPQNWERIVEYMNHYESYLAFALHTGDYCGDVQAHYTDMYATCTPARRPIYNCVGNHDTNAMDNPERIRYVTSKERTHSLLFNHTEGWDAEFMPAPTPTAYFKDFPASAVRLIVLDQYYDVEAECAWLDELLTDARERSLSVITAMHEPSDHVNDSFRCAFHTQNDYDSVTGMRHHAFEDVLCRHTAQGGIHICNLVGHTHHDLFGFTEGGILNCAVPCATNWAGWCDGIRVPGTRTNDCFHVVSIDPNLSLFKIVRIGDNCDHYLRPKRVLCYNYKTKELLHCH